jgi:hypothetical protein
MSNKQKLVSPPEGGGTILDKESYETILEMLKSRDEANHLMVQTMLTQCNVEKSIYWIWQLAKNGYYVNNMVNLRTKLGRKFRDDSSLFWLSGTSEKTFASWLRKKGWLTPWIWAQLKQKIYNTHKNSFSNEFYEVTLTLKPEYEVYNIDPQQLKLIEHGD